MPAAFYHDEEFLHDYILETLRSVQPCGLKLELGTCTEIGFNLEPDTNRPKSLNISWTDEDGVPFSGRSLPHGWSSSEIAT